MTDKQLFDVAIVGGGIAGSVAAWAMHDTGLSVALIDAHDTASPIFRAERISQQTAETLKTLGLFDRLERVAIPLNSTATIKRSHIEEVVQNTDYSAPLWKLVAELRAGMEEAGINVVVDRADAAETSPTKQTIQLHSGNTLNCKLLVVATGNAMKLQKSLGVVREIISNKHSTTFGFDIEPGKTFQLPSDSVSVRIYKEGADYLNIFPTPNSGYRGNLFTYWPAGGEQVRQFAKSDLNAVLDRLAPQMKKVTGQWKAVGKVQCGSMNVVKSTKFAGDGFVLIGDAYGRICPCLGNGIQKALGDVIALRSQLPQWIHDETPLTWQTISQYYGEPSRKALEEHLFKYSLFIRNRLVNQQFGWQLRRWYYDQLPLVARRLVRKIAQRSFKDSLSRSRPVHVQH